MNSTFVSRWMLFLLAPAVAAVDWPNYRGPRYDGSTPEGIRTNWQEKSPAVLWKKALGPGWSSISVAGGRAITQVKRTINGEPQEVVVALDAATGAELWATPVGTAVYGYSLSGAAPDSLDGPRSTPTIDGDRVFVISSFLNVVCLNATNGEVVWSRDVRLESGDSNTLPWHNAASPLVVDGRIFLNTRLAGNKLSALSTTDGRTLWSAQNDESTHATPGYFTVGGIPQVLFLTMSGLVGVVPDTGAVLWRYGFSPSSTSTAASPLAIGDTVYASAAYSRGAWTARITRNGNSLSAVQTLYQRETQYQNHWASSVPHEGLLYGIVEAGSGRSLACYDLAGRTNRWRVNQVGSSSPGYASLIKAKDTLLVLTDDGELVLVKPDSAGYVELGRKQILSAYCWNQPTVANGRLYARNSSEIIALDVAATPAPPPVVKLSATTDLPGDTLRLTVRSADGSALDSAAASQLRVEASGTEGGAWVPLPGEFLVQDGALVFPVALTGSGRLLRVRLAEAGL